MGINEILQEALRILFLVNAPFIIGIVVVGTIASALMAATNIREEAFSYALRLIVLIVIAYAMSEYMITWLIDLTKMGLS